MLDQSPIATVLWLSCVGAGIISLPFFRGILGRYSDTKKSQQRKQVLFIHVFSPDLYLDTSQKERLEQKFRNLLFACDLIKVEEQRELGKTSGKSSLQITVTPITVRDRNGGIHKKKFVGTINATSQQDLLEKLENQLAGACRAIDGWFGEIRRKEFALAQSQLQPAEG